MADTLTLSKYAIRIRGTNEYFCTYVNGRCSHSRTYPQVPNKNYPPRLHPSKAKAKRVIEIWKRGEHRTDGDGCVDIKHIPSRKLVDLEIVPVTIILNEASFEHHNG